MKPEELRVRLADEVLLLDGAMGTMLIAAGLEAGRAPDCWNLERPQAVAGVHRAYLEAGSRAILTNTFGSSPPQLSAAGLTDRCAEINCRAVEIAKTAAGDRALVTGDIGPCGLLLPPVGEANEGAIAEAFTVQASALAAAGVDLLLVETMFDLREAVAAVKAACATGLATVASMTFVTRPRGTFTIMGNPLAESLQTLADLGAVAVGCNCSVASAEMVGMIRALGDRVQVPFVAQPNAGRPRTTLDGAAYDASEESFAEDLVAMSELGARVVGGCCGTTPEFIRRTRAALDAAGKPGRTP